MKTLIASALSLLLGFLSGWYIEHRHSEREKNEIVQQMVEGGESSDGEHAARAARAIQFIESGEPKRAVELLSGPVAHYYLAYGELNGNERRSKLRSLVEGLAKTNPVVAARMAELATNSQPKTP